MPREKKGLVRKSRGQSKDPDIYFIIAAEGEVTEILYFRELESRLTSLKIGRLIKLEILERPSGISGDSLDVINSLDKYRKKFLVGEDDEFWCIIDRDTKRDWNIADAAKLCRDKNYEFCLPTPCFELWLLLHLLNLNEISATDKAALLVNKRNSPGQRTNAESLLNELVKQFGGTSYKKDRLSPIFFPRTPLAVGQAFELGFEKDHWSSDKFCSRLHILIKRVLNLQGPEYTLPSD